MSLSEEVFSLFLNLKNRKREKTVQNTVEENAFS
jgi:hypothetical protein